jgi:hypothetical protein
MTRAALMVQAAAGLEYLEGRQMLSASHSLPKGGGHGTQQVTAIEFSAAPAAVQTGLDTLATTDGLTDPTSTQTVTLHNVGGVETYSVAYSSTGTKSTITVDQNGNAVTAATTSTTTFGTLSGTGTGSDSAAATELSAIATALGLTAPASTTTVNVTTTASGAVVYSVKLASATSTANYGGSVVSVDASGNPVGNQSLPLSVIPATIANALTANAPSGATALTSSSIVHVQTIDGVTLYSATFTSTGTKTTITVNAAGVLASLPSETTTTFAALSSVVQTELQTLATASGYTATIAATQSINVYTEANGTVLYSVTLSTTSSTTTYPLAITVTSDENGNPTTLPGGRNGGPGGPGGPGGGDCGGDDEGGSGSVAGSSGGTTSSGSTTSSTTKKSSSKAKKK